MYELRNQAVLFDRAVALSPLMAEGREITGFKAIWNTNTGKPVTVVSDRYNLVQHEMVVKAVADAIMNLNIPAEARVRDAHNRLFVDISFPDAKLYVQKGEEFFAGIRVVNSYDKTTGIVVAPRLVRLACLNGMVLELAYTKGYNIHHTAKMAEDFQSTIELMLKDMVNSNDKLKALVNDCIGDSIEWALMDRILNSMAGAQKHFAVLRDMLLKIENPTRWDLYNAFTNYATHGEQLSPNVEAVLQSKAQKILVTPLIQLVPKQPQIEGQEAPSF